MRINLFYDYSVDIDTSRTWGSCKWKITPRCKCWKYIFFYVRYMPKTLVELNLLRLILITLQVYSTDLKKLTLLETPLITPDSSLKDTPHTSKYLYFWRCYNVICVVNLHSAVLLYGPRLNSCSVGQKEKWQVPPQFAILVYVPLNYHILHTSVFKLRQDFSKLCVRCANQSHMLQKMNRYIMLCLYLNLRE